MQWRMIEESEKRKIGNFFFLLQLVFSISTFDINFHFLLWFYLVWKFSLPSNVAVVVVVSVRLWPCSRILLELLKTFIYTFNFLCVRWSRSWLARVVLVIVLTRTTQFLIYVSSLFWIIGKHLLVSLRNTHLNGSFMWMYRSMEMAHRFSMEAVEHITSKATHVSQNWAPNTQ